MAAFSSLRPLLASTARPCAPRGNIAFLRSRGILRITGGKFTTYRAMSEEAADAVAANVAPDLRSIHVTAGHPLNGNTAEAINALRSDASAMAAKYSVDASEINHLVSQYGVLAPAVLEGMHEAELARGCRRLTPRGWNSPFATRWRSFRAIFWKSPPRSPMRAVEIYCHPERGHSRNHYNRWFFAAQRIK